MARFSRILSLPILLLLSLCPALSAQTFTETVVDQFTQKYATSLSLASDGNFYGTTNVGGDNALGSVFRITPSGSYSTVYSFTTADGPVAGSEPSGLIQGTDGNFYGTLENSGAGDCGGIFSVTPAGKMTPVDSFTSEFCDYPNAIIQGTDGNFYGTNFSGGPSFLGSVFQLSPAGVYTDLYDFTGVSDGGQPSGSLLENSPGVFYGTASGAVFRIDSFGSFSVVAHFPEQGGVPGQSHGLTLGTDGNFYGCLEYGAVNQYGTIFRMTPAGVITILYTFTGGADQADPADLLLGGDGNLYGDTNSSKTGTYGTLFQITESGAFKTILTLSGGATGSSPGYDLVQGPSGVLYETASFDGANGDGLLFSLTAAPAIAQPITVTVSPTSVATGGAIAVSYTVANGYGSTNQLCFGTTTPATTSAWSGIKTGKPTTQTVALNAPIGGGTYTYALTCGGRESGFATLTVGSPKATSSTGLTATLNPSSVGQTVTLKAVVAGSDGTPTGTATFAIDGNAIAAVNLAGGSASLPVSTNGLPAGTYPLVATYSGNSSYDTSASPTYKVVINASPTITMLQANPNPVNPPASVTFTATVKRSASGASGTPTGSVGFYFGANLLDTAAVNSSGVATFTVSTSGLPAGSYPLTAKYLGDGSDVASVSQAVTAVVK
jgi:uncharacterized repeat protein (TIGR03803 family)